MPAVLKGNTVELLPDNEQMGQSITQRLRSAASEVRVAQLWIDTNFSLRPSLASGVAPTLFLEELESLARRGVTVRVLMNENALIPDTYDEVKDWFADRNVPNVSIRRFPLSYETMHSKFICIDPGTANSSSYIIGSPFQQGYWDTQDHKLSEVRRGKVALQGIGLRPVHDVSARLSGPSSEAIANLFTLLWNHRSDAEYLGADRLQKLNLGGRVRAGGIGSSVAVNRTLPKNVFTSPKNGVKEILADYVDAIRAASDFIYLENQYFTSKSIVQALKDSLAAKPDLQLILLINESPDIPTYRWWQDHRLFNNLAAPSRQIGVFTLWSVSPPKTVGNNRGSIQQVYVHSKCAVIDDSFATVGTANLDGISLDSSELPFGAGHRSVEVNASVYGDNTESRSTINAIRETLWDEHLSAAGNPPGRPQTGWLDAWNKAAAANVQGLSGAQNVSMPRGRVLPYRREPNELSQLRALGIATAGLTVLK